MFPNPHERAIQQEVPGLPKRRTGGEALPLLRAESADAYEPHPNGFPAGVPVIECPVRGYGAQRIHPGTSPYGPSPRADDLYMWRPLPALGTRLLQTGTDKRAYRPEPGWF